MNLTNHKNILRLQIFNFDLVHGGHLRFTQKDAIFPELKLNRRSGPTVSMVTEIFKMTNPRIVDKIHRAPFICCTTRS